MQLKVKTKSIRKQMSNLLTDIGSREELAPVDKVSAFYSWWINPDVKDGFTPRDFADPTAHLHPANQRYLA